MKSLLILALVGVAIAKDKCIDEENDCAHYGSKACKSSHGWKGDKTEDMDGNPCEDVSALSDAFGSDALFSGNKCGNPDASDMGPWCFVSGNPVPCFKPCSEPTPEPKKKNKKGKKAGKPMGKCVDKERQCAHVGFKCATRYGFVGAKTETKDGVPCQNWADQVSDAFGSSEFGKLNYCFNPDASSEGPWCYIDGGRDFCFPPCED